MLRVDDSATVALEWGDYWRYLSLDVLEKYRAVNDTPTEHKAIPAAPRP